MEMSGERAEHLWRVSAAGFSEVFPTMADKPLLSRIDPNGPDYRDPKVLQLSSDFKETGSWRTPPASCSMEMAGDLSTLSWGIASHSRNSISSEIPSVGDALHPETEFLRAADGEPRLRFLAMEAALDLDLDEDREEASLKRKSISKETLEGDKEASEESEAYRPPGTMGRYPEILSSIIAADGCFRRISSAVGDGDESMGTVEVDLHGHGELETLLSAAGRLSRLALEVETMFSRYDEQMKKVKRDLETRIQCLTEENADMSNLLRIALVEKEAAEKNLNKLKGRKPMLQIAEWGLQKAGLGFMVTGSGEESSTDHPSSCNPSMAADAHECEEDETSLASAVEKVVKNLRQEVTELRFSLQEQRSENERLQSLTEKQIQEANDRSRRIKVLEERENMLAHNLVRAENELVRLREALTLEVEAGNLVIRECQNKIAALREDLTRTEVELAATNNRLKMKEKLADAAIAAHAAVEVSLKLADSRSVRLREVIEELTTQLEEEAEWSRKFCVRQKVRHICWPWRALRVNPSAALSGFLKY